MCIEQSKNYLLYFEQPSSPQAQCNFFGLHFLPLSPFFLACLLVGFSPLSFLSLLWHLWGVATSSLQEPKIGPL